MSTKNLEEWTKLADFLKKRGDIPTNTAATYIKRHAEQFEGHTKRRNEKTPLYIDSVAAELLNEVYPLQEVIVVEGVPQAEYDALKAKYDGLAAQIETVLVETNKMQQSVQKAWDEVKQLQEEKTKLIVDQQAAELKLKSYKNRGLIQRILNKDVE